MICNTPKHTMLRNGRIFPQSSQYEYAEGVEFEVWVAVNEKGE